jgi:hypothetical protein
MSKDAFIFGKKNYVLLITGLAFVAIGYLLMMGGGSDDPNVFNEDIFSARRIVIAPLFVLAGFVIEIYAIMSKPTEETAQ